MTGIIILMVRERGNSLESVSVGRIELSDDTRIDFLERSVAGLATRVHSLEESVKQLRGERFINSQEGEVK